MDKDDLFKDATETRVKTLTNATERTTKAVTESESETSGTKDSFPSIGK